MRHVIVTTVMLGLAAPAAAQDEGDGLSDGLNLLGEGTRMILEGLMEDMRPMLEEVRPFFGRRSSADAGSADGLTLVSMTGPLRVARALCERATIHHFGRSPDCAAFQRPRRSSAGRTGEVELEQGRCGVTSGRHGARAGGAVRNFDEN